MTLTNETHRTEWSLPVRDDLPRDTLQAQLEVYQETVLLRASRATAPGSGPFRRTKSPTCSPGTWASPRAFSPKTPSGGARGRPGSWWPCGARPRSGRWPCNGRPSSLPPGSGCPCRAGLRLLAGRAPWVYAALERPTGPEQQLYRTPAFNIFRDGRTCPGSHRFPEEVGKIPESFFQSFFSLTEIPGTGRRSTRTTCKPYGRNSMDKLTTRLRTWFPNAPWARSWPSPKDGVATTNAATSPVGYLVNHPAGLSGFHGVGYDYVLGAGGLYVQSESAHLTARVLVAPAQVRGLASVSEKLGLAHGPIPAHVFELGLAWMLASPDTERFFAIRWDGDAYRLVVPPQEGTGSSLTYQPPTGVVAEFHSHASHQALLLRHRRPGRAGVPRVRRRGTPGHARAGIDPAPRHLRPLRPAPLVPGLRRLAARCPPGGQ